MWKWLQTNLDVTSLPRTETIFVPTDISYILLADKAVAAIGIGFRRMFRLHLGFKWESEELATLLTVSRKDTWVRQDRSCTISKSFRTSSSGMLWF